jgi:hypothetical protein
MAQQVQVTEEQARAVAEESRASGWDKPSFAKELFLGRFGLQLIHPFPRPADGEEKRTAEFLHKLRGFLGTVDGRIIERDARIPDDYIAEPPRMRWTRWSNCRVRWPTTDATTFGSRRHWQNCGPAKWPV